MADPAPKTAFDAFNEASPSGGVEMPVTEEAQARAIAQDNARRNPPAPPPERSILDTSYSGPGVPIPGVADPGLAAGDPVAAYKMIHDAVTGEGSVKRPEIPALNLKDLGLEWNDPKTWGVVGQMVSNRDPAALERSIKSRVPNAYFQGDGVDRTVQVPGGPEMHLDKPGWTPQKGLYYSTQAGIGLLSQGRSILAQAGLAALQHATSQLLSNQVGGAESPIDPIGTAISAAVPVGLGAATSGLIKGYDWLTSDVVGPTAEDISRLGVQGLSKAQQYGAWVADRARNLYRWGFAGKPGDITGDPGALAREDLAANSSNSPDAAKDLMKTFNDRNAATKQATSRRIIGEISGDHQPGQVPDNYAPNEGDFGDKVNAAIVGRDAANLAEKNAAWAKFGPISPDTAGGQSLQFSSDVSRETIPKLRQVMRDTWGDPQGTGGTFTPAQLNDEGATKVANAVDQIRRIMLPEGRDFAGFNLGHFQDMRQTVSNVLDNTQPGTTAFRAATQVKKILDDAIDNAITTPGRVTSPGMAGADPTKLADFRAANAATAKYMAFRNPAANPQAAAVVQGAAPAAGRGVPATGQETIDKVLGAGGVVGPGGGTNAILVHLNGELGDDAMRPLAGAMTMRSLYGTKGTTEVPPGAPSTWDYDSTAGRIHAQLRGDGAAVSDALLTPEQQSTLQSYRDALWTLGSANRKGGPRQNAPGSGYLAMMMPDVPALGGFGKMFEKGKLYNYAKEATAGGADLVDRAVRGAVTPSQLQVRVPRTSALGLEDPQNPFWSWQRNAWRSGLPAYRVGGTLLGPALDQRQ